MKVSSILLSLALAFKAVNSKAINDKITFEQINVVEEDSSFELVESDNFIYKFHCSEEPEYCNKLKDDLDFAFNSLSNAFEFYQPIVFEVFVDDLIKKYKFNALAAVTDSNYVPLKTSRNRSSTSYLYPQALVKQLKLNKQPKYKKNDFIMLINNCNSIPKSKDNEIRSIMLHEIFHGLGFISLTQVDELTNNDVFNIDAPDQQLRFNETAKYAIFPYMAPLYSEKLLEITDEEEYINQLTNTEASSFLPLSIFDKNIASLKTGKKIFADLKSYHKEVNEKCLPKDGTHLILKDIHDKFSKNCFESLSSKTQETITSIIRDNYFSCHTLGILTKDGDMVPLQTMDKTYFPGSSISHPNDPLYDEIFAAIRENRTESIMDLFENDTLKIEAAKKYYDENFILYFSDDDDLTVEQMLELLPNNEKHPLIGDGIVKIMETIGWTEKGKKRSSQKYYLDESLDVPEGNSFEYMYKRRYEISKHEEPSTEVETETETAFMEEETTFPEEVEVTTPVDEDEDEVEVEATTPVDEDEDEVEVEATTPIDEDEVEVEVEATTPIDEDEVEVEATTPIDEDEDEVEVEATTPIDEDEDEVEVEATTPVDEDEDEVEVEATTPVDENEVDEEESAFPEEKAEATTPVDEEEVNEEEPTLPVEVPALPLEDETSLKNQIRYFLEELKKIFEMIFHI